MIDWSRVEELRKEIGPEDFGEIAALFVEETAEMIGKLPAASRDDLPGILHFLKGSAENVGFRELGILCKRGELAIDDGRAVDREEIVTVFDKSCAVFAERIGAESGIAI